MGFEDTALRAQAAGDKAYTDGIEGFADRVARAEKTLTDFQERITNDPSFLDKPGVLGIIEKAERILEEAGEELPSKLIH